MKEIMGYIHEGYSIPLQRIEFSGLYCSDGSSNWFIIENWLTALCFVVGAIFSILAGYFGMQVATS